MYGYLFFIGVALYLDGLVLTVYSSTLSADERYSLPVLLLLPYPDSSPDSGWDRGLELLPAARVAANEINNMTSLLPGYRLQLIEKSSDACGVSQTSIGINSFVQGVFGGSENTIAVLGLACSTVTSTISPLAGRDQVSLIQIAIANSHILRNQTEFPHLWRVISAVSVNINATLSLMDRFNWTRVAQIYDGNGIFFRSSADIFRNVINSNKKYDLVLDQAIDEDPSFIENSLRSIQEKAVRIIFVSATVPEAKLLMCEAAKSNLIWPGYVWIFHSRTNVDLFDPNCDVNNLLKAIENVTLLDLNLQGRENDEVLVSGQTYQEYLDAYNREAENIRLEFQTYLTDFTFTTTNPFANPLYDEVWALALAINASLPDLQNKSLHLEDYQYNVSEITEVIEHHLRNVEFEGAVSKVKFNSLREASTPVVLFQLRNGTSVEIGRYDETTDVLVLYNISEEAFPDDDFVIVYNFIIMEVVILYFTVSVIVVIFTTAMVISMFLLYSTPEVRAASPLLSLLVFFGCYLLTISVPVSFVRQSFQLNENVFSALCIADRWLVESGHCIIGITILLRLVRVAKIFHGFAKLGNLWKDKFLVIYAILLSTVPSIIHIVWAVVAPLTYQPIIETRNDLNPPSIIITPACASSNAIGYAFEFASIFYAVCISLLLMIYAFRTRRINYSDFKDTKKLFIFIYIFAILIVLVYGFSFLFRTIGRTNAIVTMVGTFNLLEAVGVQLFFYFPKILPAAYNKVNKKAHSTFPGESLNANIASTFDNLLK